MTAQSKLKRVRSCRPLAIIDLEEVQGKNDATRKVGNLEDGDILALRPKFDRRAHAHHIARGHCSPQNFIPEILTGRNPIQNNQLSQPKYLAPHILPNKTLPMVEQKQHRQNSD